LSRHSRNTLFAQEWHFPQQVAIPRFSRNSDMEDMPESTACRIFRSDTLLQTQTIILYLTAMGKRQIKK